MALPALGQNLIATSFLLATSVLLALRLTHAWSSACHRLSGVVDYRFSISNKGAIRRYFDPGVGLKDGCTGEARMEGSVGTARELLDYHSIPYFENTDSRFAMPEVAV